MKLLAKGGANELTRSTRSKRTYLSDQAIRPEVSKIRKRLPVTHGTNSLYLILISNRCYLLFMRLGAKTSISTTNTSKL